jgi:hypothetical protein
MLEGVVPYDKQSCLDILSTHGMAADDIGFCSKDMAARLAKAQLQRSFQLTRQILHWPDLYGLSATATIVSHYKRRGDYRVHVGVAGGSLGNAHTMCFTFAKGYRERHEEDSAVAHLALAALHEATGHGPMDHSETVVSKAYSSKNAVGEETDLSLAGPPEVPPVLMPYRGDDDDGGDDDDDDDKWRVEILSAVGGETKTVIAPDSKLPQKSMVIIPSKAFCYEESYKAVLTSLGLDRVGEMGKSWSTAQPPTLILNNEYAPKNAFQSPAYFAPDLGSGEDEVAVVFENWGLLKPPTATTSSDESGGCAYAFQVVHKYRHSGCMFYVSAEQFFALAVNTQLLLTCVNKGGSRFVVDCGGKIGLTNRMLKLLDEVGSEDFNRIVHAVDIVNSRCRLESSGDFNDGSPSTKDAASVRVGDDGADGYVSVTWENGITYRGFLADGKFDGWGAKMYSRGGGYFGNWKEGVRSGRGRSIYGGKWGNDYWEGPWEGDLADGEGRMVKVDGSVQDGFAFIKGSPQQLEEKAA